MRTNFVERAQGSGYIDRSSRLLDYIAKTCNLLDDGKREAKNERIMFAQLLEISVRDWTKFIVIFTCSLA